MGIRGFVGSFLNPELPSEIEEARRTFARQARETQTIENNSYIPLRVPMPNIVTPHTHAEDVLKALDSFEKSHPDLEVISYTLDHLNWGTFTETLVTGIFVHHKPR